MPITFAMSRCSLNVALVHTSVWIPQFREARASLKLATELVTVLEGHEVPRM